MNNQTEKAPLLKDFEVIVEAENPIQERHFESVVDSFVLSAEAVIRIHMQKVQAEFGQGNAPLFIP